MKRLEILLELALWLPVLGIILFGIFNFFGYKGFSIDKWFVEHTMRYTMSNAVFHVSSLGCFLTLMQQYGL